MQRPRERLTVNLSAELTDRIRSIRLDERLSASVVVEHALRMFLEGLSDHQVAEQLRAVGATIRRHGLANRNTSQVEADLEFSV